MAISNSLEKDYNSELFPNYDEYNKNNRIVNDVNYSYYLNTNNNLQNKTDNSNFNINNDFNENIKNNDNGLNTSRDQIINQNNNYNTENNLNNSQNRLITPSNLTGRISSPINIKAEEKIRKKILLDNIQAQINLRRETKLKELQKTKEEDAQYLKDMFEKYPFGRGGGGAPIRNKKGEILTPRRNLISDLKYNQSSINVDDDYDEVRGNSKSKNKKSTYNSTTNIYFNKNKYEPEKSFYSTLNTNNLNNNRNQPIKLNASYDFRNYNNDLDKAIYERKLKQLELQKVQEEIKNAELREENDQLEYDLYVQDTKKNKNLKNYKNKNNNNRYNNYTNNTLTEENEEYETTTDNNNINNNYNNYNNDIQYFNDLDYYDNFNFVPKSRINQRLDNNFLFSEELSKMRRDFETKQISLLNQISKLKDATLLAKEERNKVNKNLSQIQLQLDKLKNEKNILNENKIKNEEDTLLNNYDNKDYNTYEKNNLYRNENDYNYIDDKFFKKYEKELPYNTKMKKESNIFHLEKNYEDRDLIELDKLIKKSDDIIQNLKENDLLEKKFKKKPADYFNTSDYFFDTYMLKHKNDYLEYDNEYKNKSRYNNVKNKFIDFNDNDYEI